MESRRTIIYLDFVFVATFCVTPGSCTEHYKEVGVEVKLDCPGPSSDEIEWKLNSVLLLRRSKSGTQRRGIKSLILL